MFSGYSSLVSLDLPNMDTSSVIDRGSQFSGCISLISIDLTKFDISSVKNMASMFSRSNSLESLDLSHFDTSSVTNIGAMFAGCGSLKSINLSNFYIISNKYAAMFNACSSLKSIDLSNFNSSLITSTVTMFALCSSKKIFFILFIVEKKIRKGPEILISGSFRIIFKGAP